MSKPLSDYGDDFFEALLCAVSDMERSTESIRAQMEKTLGRCVLKFHVMSELNELFADGLIKRTVGWIQPAGRNQRQVSMWRWAKPHEEVA